MKCRYCNSNEEMDRIEEVYNNTEEIHICDNCGARCILEYDLKTGTEKLKKWWNPKLSAWE